MNIFEIRNLICSYDKNLECLRIKKLDIPHNKLVILLGKSGAGKSTILETLGLMNFTIKSGSIKFIPYSEEPENYFYLEKLWKNGNENDIANIRNKYYSFIFQNTNLMPNFTAYENACITQMIQGKSQTESYVNVKKIMKELGLEEVNDEKRACEMAGGQRQRLAFVRAITSNFSILFGDEPTGNIDEFTSIDLMNILYNKIISQKKTAIIVSHNIQLSINYANILIILSKPKGETSCGEIIEENIYKCFIDDKENRIWYDFNDNKVDNIREKIDLVMKN